MGWLALVVAYLVVLAGSSIAWWVALDALPWASMVGRITVGVLGAAGVLLGLHGLRRVSAADFGAGRGVGTIATVAMVLIGIDAGFAGLWGAPLSTTTIGLVIVLALGIGIAFALLVTLLRLVLRINLTTFAVARQVVDETLRMKVAVAFLVALVLAIAAMPFIVGGNDALRYQVQQFLAYSIGLTGLLLGLMTIFAACSTLSGEIEGKQAFTVMTKPIDRGRYLLGKWLGLTLLNVVLLAVAGGAIYAFVMLHMVRQPAMDGLDRASLHEEVLTARVSVPPSMPTMARDEAERWVDRFLQAEGNVEDVRALLRQVGGRSAVIRRLSEGGAVEAQAMERLRDQMLGGGAAYIDEQGGARAALDDIRRRLIKAWRSMGPYGGSHNSTTFVFRDLDDAKKLGQSVQLQFKLDAGGSVGSETRVGWRVNGRQIGAETYPLDIQQRLMLDTAAIDEEHQLVVTAYNLNPAGSVTFERDDGVKLYYTAGRFGPNLARGMAVMAVKLSFLTALGLTAATFLGFPVASLLALMIFAGAEASPFIIESTRSYGITPDGPTFFAQVVTAIAKGIGVVLRQYAAFEPTSALTNGRMIGWATLGLCIAWIGVAWTGLTFVVGWLIFRRRELARVQV